MKPRSAREKRVVQLNALFKDDLCKRDYECVISNCYPHEATVQSKKRNILHCLDCGHNWYSDKMSGKVKCPHCGKILNVVEGRQRVFTRKFWYARLEKCEEFQVIRTYLAICKTGQPPRLEECQRVFYWLGMGGANPVVCSRRKCMNAYYYDVFSMYSDIDLRDSNIVGSYCYRIKSLKPWLKQRGMKQDNQWSAGYLVKTLLTDNLFETYFKLGYVGACEILYNMKEKYNYTSNHNVEAVKTALKIAVRHDYQPLKSYKDYKLWADMIDYIVACGGDVHNPLLVCPENLWEAHNKWLAKMDAMGVVDKGDMAKWNRHQNNKNNNPKKVAEYNEKMKSFMMLNFQQNGLHINVITSVDKMIEEGMKMHHCVGDYWLNHSNSLIFSIRDKHNLRLATAEVRLSDYEVPQVYADHDKASPYREQITRLLRHNSKIIAAQNEYAKKLRENETIRN